MKHKT